LAALSERSNRKGGRLPTGAAGTSTGDAAIEFDWECAETVSRSSGD
jgi:hypothetical protein